MYLAHAFILLFLTLRLCVLKKAVVHLLKNSCKHFFAENASSNFKGFHPKFMRQQHQIEANIIR
ncbi:hypothetical protein BV372_07375 [Nostoc sp. T09]|nr:hypothetical protein BV372_07375 [Nostoc sp. T09]